MQERAGKKIWKNTKSLCRLHPKLTPGQVDEIRSSTESQRSLARRFGVSKTAIVNRKNKILEPIAAAEAA
jgi:DNA-binding transcriptional regulator YiaG